MQKNRLGRSDVFVTEEILGCWVMGGSYWGGAQDRESIEAIHAALEGGITSFDTAYIYGNGRSEQVLGQALKGENRESLTVISKLWKSSMHRDKVAKACEESLKALEMDYLDVYFIHYPADDGTPIGETMEQLMALKTQGKIRCIGVSNFSLAQLQEACRYGEVDVIQPCYSLVWRFPEHKDLAYCREQGIGVIPYSGLAQGILTGKFQPDTVFPPDDGRSRVPLFQPPYYQGALEVTRFLQPYAEKYGKTLAQVAINWLIQTPGISAPIIGGRTAAQVKENLKAACWQLSPGDYQEIDRFSKAFTDTLPSFRTFFDGTIVKD